jgi:hypothetical protein
MSIYYKYRVRCKNDNRDEFWILKEGEPVPTKCPTNTNHEIDPNQTTIVEVIEQSVVRIQEEDIPTGGNFGTRSIKVIAKKGQTTETWISWPIPISGLEIIFTSEEKHRGDCFSIGIGKNTIVGAITAPIFPAQEWEPKNYKAHETVLFFDPRFGQRSYTCFVDTVNNEPPINSNHWRHGMKINVTKTVIENVKVGYYVQLTDGLKATGYCEVMCIDKQNNGILIEKSPTEIYSPLSPTYVMISVYMIKDYEIGPPWENDIGASKIGGSYIPADTLVSIEYVNHSDDEDKIFLGRIEYLY